MVLSGTALSWFSSCLIERYQRVKIANCFSAALPTSCDVPRGSVLEPLLFILYTTQLSSVIQSHLDHHLYEDATQIYLSLATPVTNCSLNKLRYCLQNVFHWVTNIKFKVNANKAEFHIIGTQKQRVKLDCFFPNIYAEPEFHTGRLSTEIRSHL